MRNSIIWISCALVLMGAVSATHAAAPFGETISLYSDFTASYVTADAVDGYQIEAKDISSVGMTERFVVEDAGSGNIRLKAVANDNYVKVDPANVKKMFANTTSTTDTLAHYQWTELSGGKIRLTSIGNGLNVSPAGATFVLRANTTSTGPETEFTWAIDSGVTPASGWRVVPEDVNYPTDDIIVAFCDVTDAGYNLPADPANTDCTVAFQVALDDASSAGGGTVFVPDGEYRIDGPLTMGANVTLRGRWREITATQPASGTILKLYQTGTNAVLTLAESSSGLRDLTFWHPDQDPAAINTNYPFVIQGEANVMTLENITLINAVKGIDSSKASFCCFRGIYGSPLNLGLTADQSFAVSRFDSIHFSPDYWAWSGLTNSPAAGGAHETYIRSNGLAVNIKEMDGFYFQSSVISGYRDGVLFERGISGDNPHGDLSYLTITNCTVALNVVSAKSFKVLGCTFSGSTYGLYTQDGTDMSINTCTIEGGTNAIRTTSGGDLNLVNCTVNGSENRSGGTLVKSSYDTIMPAYSFVYDAVRKPAETNLFNVKDYGAVGDQSTDDTAAFQSAIAAATNNGGGIVFVPDGEYVVNGHLDLGVGVELRGISGGRQQADSDTELGSLILINNAGGSETGTPFIKLGDHSGVRSISFHYLDQDIVTFVPHPWMIQGNGMKNYIIDCFASNPYQAAELNGDDHLVEYTFFGGIRATYRANTCSGGRIQNCHIKPDFWRNIEIGNYPATLTEVHETKWRQTQQVEIFHLNGCDDYSISSIFNHASHQFMTADNSSGQTLMISAEQVQKGYAIRNGTKTFNFLNSSCNINSVGDYSGNYGIKTESGFKGNARFFVSSIWGTSDSTWDASDGKLYLQQCYVAGPSNRGCINFRCRPGGNIKVESGNSSMRFGLENEGVFTMQDFDFRNGCLFSATRDYVDDNLIDETYIVADVNQDPALAYGIALDTNNIVIEDAMIMPDSDPADLNDQRRVKGARLSSGSSYSLDVTEPEFSDGIRSDVDVEVYMLIDTFCTNEVWYHSSSGMKKGKTLIYDGSTTNAAWKTISFRAIDAEFGTAEDIRVDVTGASPLLAMVLVSSTDIPSRHIGNVVLSNDDNSNTTSKTWTVSSLNTTNPVVSGSAATVTGFFTADGELGSSDNFAISVSSVIDWSTANAQAAIATNGFASYLANLPNGTVAGYQGNLGADSGPVYTDDNPNQLGNSLLEALVYTVDAADLPSGDLYLTGASFQRYAGDDRTDFVIYDISENAIIEQQWNANYDGADVVSGSWKLETGDKIIIGTGSENGANDFRVNDLTLDILKATYIPTDYDLWVALHGGAGLIGDETFDYDSDGLANLGEYALDGNPTNELDTGVAPSLVNATGAMWFIHPQRSDDASLIYTVETSTNLVSGIWTNAGYTVSATNVTGSTLNYVTNAVPTDFEQTYIRLKVER
ncbi:glycosyl hydrolase family 28-related protein [Pontiella sulfatireligans]|uniref:Rhamnogalacturonase A/B/Epimerase-like pectate lyase domain-containing protein n=1 Tax=Pontiella sulfatireligans TaxID=2750658 RepID=A0A6C2UU77_9BACT|nr:glycosyl hydrolase family 28-related protein [Pontiella sulfatireligans]VGO23533.1 hypothetical protein SCARR_05640 [Pontiella sulfatireligans]